MHKEMALSGIKCPQMQWDGDNLKENWRRFKQHVELMLSGPLKSLQEAEKCSYLLIWVGQKDEISTIRGATSAKRTRVSCKHITIASKLTSVSEQTLSSLDLNFTAAFRDRPKQQRNSSQG